jgi:phosphatidylglycerophosphate synthase
MTEIVASDWKTKPTDRFILKWIKINLSSRVTITVIKWNWLKPWMITVLSMINGMFAGVLFAFGAGFFGGVFASLAQVLDGVDGQVARLREQATAAGAFLDSVLDRYSDGTLVIGLTIFNLRNDLNLDQWHILILGTFALLGSGLISYSSSRAASLRIGLGRPTLASKGSRTAVVAFSGLLSPISSLVPLFALFYLAIHTNAVVLYRIFNVMRAPAPHNESN